MAQGVARRLLVSTSALLFLVAFVTASSVDGVVPETELNEVPPLIETALGDGDEKVAVDSQNEQVLRNIIVLRAYAISAHDAAVSMKYEHSQMGKSVVGDLLLRLGGQRLNIKEKENIVARYAKAVGLCISRFKIGVGKYIIRRITKAMRLKSGVVSIYKDNGLEMVGLDHKALGFVSRPAYIRRLGVRLDQYVRAKRLVTHLARGADHAAALACLLRGKIKAYRSFYQRVKSKYTRHAANYWQKMLRGAEDNERESFRKHHHLGKQVKSGKVGAQQVLDHIMKLQRQHKMPSKAKMRAEAKLLATKWLKSNQHSCDVKPFVHHLDQKARGCVALKTPNKYKYKNTKPPTEVQGNFALKVSVKAKNDAHIALSRTPKFHKGKNEMYEIVIGGWGNSKICIRDKQRGRCLASKTFKEPVLNKFEHRRFYIRRNGSVLSVDKKVNGKYHTLLRWGGYGKIKAQYLSVSTGRGALGRWLVCGRKTKEHSSMPSSILKKASKTKKKAAKKAAQKKKSVKKKAITVKKKALAEAVQANNGAVSPLEEEHEEHAQEKKEAEEAAAEAERLDDEAKQELREEGA